jgi:general secretion pathway protein A
LLTNLETSSEKLLQIVLSGQPELEEKLRDPSVRQLRQRISIWCRTQQLTADQTQTYITERLRIGGATEPAFTPEAALLVHQYSKGIPRLINLICEHAMISAFVEQVKPIPARIVDSVSIELDMEQQPFVISPMAMSGFPEMAVPAAVSSPVNQVADSNNLPKESEL